MDDVVEVTCPYCGETLSLFFELETQGALVQDCDVCCRPLQLEVAHGRSGELLVSVDRAQ